MPCNRLLLLNTPVAAPIVIWRGSGIESRPVALVTSTGPSYFQSPQWGNGKWLFSAVDGNRYLVMPTGQVLQYVTGATSPSQLPAVASLDPSVWANPVLLTSAPAPQAPTGIMLSVTGSTLTVTAPTSYTGTFRVTVTASDGALSTAQSFLVRVTV